MPVRHREIPAEVLLETKLEAFRNLNEVYRQHRRACEYLGPMLLSLSAEITELRYKTGGSHRQLLQSPAEPVGELAGSEG